ncbi:General transcription factor IIF subunit 2 [Thelohanellus kitauei]|uniref:General transcription factor IIF subunit 2 n=1 Tax=Thelohanellus kitauei TaxID=669202 RepID=A0A0C2MIY1_THEKT|nr:General transcription factor IIF subunit 2 [Thelohanellus kitauei]
MTEEVTDIDCSELNSEVYVLKVPKYAYENILKKTNGSVIGYLTQEKNRGPSQTIFNFDASGIDRKDLKEVQLAELDMASLPFSFNNCPVDRVDSIVLSRGENSSSFCGRVSKRFDLRPFTSKTYLALKKKSIIEKGNRTAESASIQDTALYNYTPKAYHGLSAKLAKKKKEDSKKLRGERSEVLQAIFKCFEKKRFYNIKDLCDQISQPAAFIREVLPEVCDCVSNPQGRDQWELKEQFRCYSQNPP